jgi:hypothetical protein
VDLNESQQNLLHLLPRFDALAGKPRTQAILLHFSKRFWEHVYDACPHTDRRDLVNPYYQNCEGDIRREIVFRGELHGIVDLACVAGCCIGAPGTWARSFGVDEFAISAPTDDSDYVTRWLCAVFEIGLAGNAGQFPVSVSRMWFYDMAIRGLEGEIAWGTPSNSQLDKVQGEIDRLKSFGFYSVLYDVALASVYAIRVLTSPPIPDSRESGTTNGKATVAKSITEACDAWIMDQWEKGATLEQIRIRLRKKPRSWGAPDTVSGVRHRRDAAYKRADKEAPKRPQGRPKNRRN